MKITGLDIGEYRQFKNIKFDFTYPKDHHDPEKTGKPLDKVCFIGQSGTGKTTLLNVIKRYFSALEEAHLGLIGNRSQIDIELDMPYDGFYIDALIKARVGDTYLEVDKKNGTGLDIIEKIKTLKLDNIISAQSLLCLYIGESIAGESEKIFANKTTNSSRLRNSSLKQLTFFEGDESQPILSNLKKTVGLRSGIGDKAWQHILKEIYNYDTELAKVAQSLIDELSTFSENSLRKKLTNWRINNSDPRVSLAERCLNPILNKFNLEVDFETNRIPLRIKTKAGTKINNSHLSTGTRQLLATAIPIYKFDTTNTVILFDEPERSLFPDIQRILIKYYTSLAPEAQFFFATHSPIIASAFEPCERFILYFNEDGEVNCRNGIAPIGDDPNDILSADFGLNDLMLDEGLEAYQEYRRLGTLIRNETDDQKKNELIVKRLELGNRYNF